MFNLAIPSQQPRGWHAGEEVKEENGLLTYIGTRLDTQESGVAMRQFSLTANTPSTN